MKKIVMVTLVVFVLVALALWTILGSRDTRGIEMPDYTVEENTPDYEVRLYAPQLRAETTLEGGYRESLYAGFRRLADFIFGNNTAQASIAMTAPVLSQASEKIAMTAPVLSASEEEGNKHVIAFVMPGTYTLETLPRPNNPDVVVRLVPGQRVAAARFGGYATAGRSKNKTDRLLAALERDGQTTAGAPWVAQYNPPWTPPWMRRNEILAPLMLSETDPPTAP